ncbi:unnamed protein product [Mytilus coruscus]|uniref:Uncharacterized protein n=1 Tax=Mytilus coruscus TaxID=42192 RepID=A0A6J8F433_MYTCO|nr:unnamed protein product [Mytilus coruscus]
MLFGINNIEAERMDPQQRYVLECVPMALEDGGITRNMINGSDTRVFIGRSSIAICGGVNSMLSPSMLIPLSRARMASPSGQCHAFSSNADGYARGEGCGIVILKKKLGHAEKDSNKIWATIATDCNQDGHTASPITAPSASHKKFFFINGQSVGEVTAVYAAGYLTMENAVAVIYHRSKILSTVKGGKMFVIGNCNTKYIESVCSKFQGKACIAVYISSTSCTVSSDADIVDILKKAVKDGLPKAEKETFLLTDLNVQCAYHSHHTEQAGNDLEKIVKQFVRTDPSISYISTVTVKTITDGNVIDASYWKKIVQDICVEVEFTRPIFLSPCQSYSLDVSINDISSKSTMCVITKDKDVIEKFTFRNSEEQPRRENIDIDCIYKVCQQFQSSEDIHDTLNNMGFSYGKHLQILGDSWKNGKQCLVQMHVSDVIWSDAKMTHFHPAILDGLLQTSSVLFLDASDDRTVLPAGIGKLILWRGIERNMIEYTELKHRSKSEVLYKMLLLTVNGSIIAEIEDFRIKIIGDVLSNISQEYTLTWENIQRNHISKNTDPTKLKKRILLCSFDRQILCQITEVPDIEVKYLLLNGKHPSVYKRMYSVPFGKKIQGLLKCTLHQTFCVLQNGPQEISKNHVSLSLHEVSLHSKCLYPVTLPCVSHEQTLFAFQQSECSEFDLLSYESTATIYEIPKLTQISKSNTASDNENIVVACFPMRVQSTFEVQPTTVYPLQQLPGYKPGVIFVSVLIIGSKCRKRIPYTHTM